MGILCSGRGNLPRDSLLQGASFLFGRASLSLRIYSDAVATEGVTADFPVHTRGYWGSSGECGAERRLLFFFENVRVSFCEGRPLVQRCSASN